MKNKILGVALCTAGMFAVSSCSDYLETSSPSTVTESSMMASYDDCRSTMDGTYSNLHSVLRDKIFGNGMFYAGDVAGSDIERHGGERAVNRVIYETFYKGGDASTLASYNSAAEFKESPEDAFSMLYVPILSTNLIINNTEGKFDDPKNGAGFKQIYGEAVCMRATCYRELIKYYGDVPGIFSSQDGTGLVSRLDIYDHIISDLQKVTEGKYLADATKANKGKFSLQYAYAVLGRIAMERASYQTFRLDITDASRLKKHPDYTDNQNVSYARAKDYQKYYDIAYDAFKYVAENPGAVTFNSSDYSEFFTQLHQNPETGFANESIFEDEQVQGAASNNSERPYSIGRPSNGGSKNAFPCKSYGQCRINPAFYYGMFDPKDVRRDVSCAITGSDGKGYETIIPFGIATTAKGAGIACGKFDENRQSKIWTANQRRAGINAPYMRMSEVYLGLAEAALMKTSPDQTTADTYYNKTHQRAGLDQASGVTLEQVIDERGFEFAAEGDRRWTLIRTGLIGKKIQAIRQMTSEMMAGLASKGYHTFANGNTISKYIYTKMVDPKSAEIGLTSRLTPATPASMRVKGFEPSNDAEAVQFPGWRGQANWENIDGFKGYGTKTQSNVAIRGLFTYIDPEGDVAKDLINNQNYTKVDWGATLIDNSDEKKNIRDFYENELFTGWDCKSAPIYLLPFTKNDCIGGFIYNGYGFMQY